MNLNDLDEALKNTPKKKTVVEYLNEIDYSMPLDYEPSDFALKFVNFIKLVNGEKGEENKTPITHLHMLDSLVSGERRITNLCARGFAKTAIMGEYFILYLAVHGKLPRFGKVSLMIYVSDSIDNGVKNMRKNLEHRWEESEFLQKYIPKIWLTDTRWEFVNSDGKKLVVKGYGASTGVRGAKELGIRPQIAILDDLVSDDDARSATVIQKIEDTIYKAVDMALHPKKNMIIWSGTPFNASDPLYKAVESGAWKVNAYPVCEHFPCNREEFKSGWPDRFTYDFVLEKYVKYTLLKKIEVFNQELMLRIMSDEDRLIPDSQIQWYNKATLMRSRPSFNFYITTDFGTSAKEAADLSVIMVWAINYRGDLFLVDGKAKSEEMDKNMDALFNFAQKYSPQSVGIEISGQQQGFIPWIQKEMMDRNIYFSLATDRNTKELGLRSTTNKMQRFNIVQPLFGAFKIFLPAEENDTSLIKETVQELQLISNSGCKSRYDDCIDGISMLGSMQMNRPSEEVEVSYDADLRHWNMMTGVQDVDSALDSYIV